MIVAAATSKDGFKPLQPERSDYHYAGRIMVTTQCVVQAVCKGVKLEKAAASVALLRNSWSKTILFDEHFVSQRSAHTLL